MSLKLKYFVLKPKSKTSSDRYAQASREAMRAYADEISDVNEKLAEELRIWAAEESHLERKLREHEINEIVTQKDDSAENARFVEMHNALKRIREELDALECDEEDE